MAPPTASAQRAELSETLSWRQVRGPLTRSVAALLALFTAGVFGFWSGRASTPGTASIEAGYVRDTLAHHAQSVTMSWTVREATTASDVRDLAREVITTEQADIGRGTGLLDQWGLSEEPDGPRMGWMRRTGHQHAGLPRGVMLLPDGRMPGMASNTQMTTLAGARGHDAEILYLQLLLIHDRATREMSVAARSASTNVGVVDLASDDEARCTQEIARITSMLAQRGSSPWTSVQAGQPVAG